MSLNPALYPDVLWGVTLAFVAMAIACMVAVAAAAKVMSSGPGFLLAAAVGVLIVIMVLMHWAGGQEGISVPTPSYVVSFALAGICSNYLGRWLVFKSIERLAPSGSAGLQNISPLITAAFGWIFFGGRNRHHRFRQHRARDCRPVGHEHGHRPFPVQDGIAGLGDAGRMAARLHFRNLADWRGFGGRIFVKSCVPRFRRALVERGLAGLPHRRRRPPCPGTGQPQADYGMPPTGAASPKAARVYLGVGGFQFLAQALVVASMKYIPASMAALI
ncbi:MAG: EamA family transporter [Pseudomonadota bacterium]